MLPAIGMGLGMLGAGAGLHALGLGQLLEPLDYPRQAAWNLIRSAGNAMAGEGTWDDALRAVPGVLGAGLGAGLMASGVGAPLGILAGSLAGGAAQGLGRMGDAQRFQAPAVQDLTGTEDFLTNMTVGMLGDPLTYAGGFGGRAAGQKAADRIAGARALQAVDADIAAMRELDPRAAGVMEALLGVPGNTIVDSYKAKLSAALPEGPVRPMIEDPVQVLKKTGYLSKDLDHDYGAEVERLFYQGMEPRPEMPYYPIEVSGWGGGETPPPNWFQEGVGLPDDPGGQLSTYMSESLGRLGAPDLRFPGTYTLKNGEIINAGESTKLVPAWRRERNGAIQNLLADEWSLPDIEELAFSMKPDPYDFRSFGWNAGEQYAPIVQNIDEAQFGNWLRSIAGRAETQTPDYQLFKREVTVPGETIMPPAPPPLPPPQLDLSAQPGWVQSLASQVLPDDLATMPPEVMASVVRGLQEQRLQEGLHPRSFETLLKAVFPGFDPAMLQYGGPVEPLLVRPPVVNWVPRQP